jgi:tRNA 2-thiouridine synthesizing protein A
VQEIDARGISSPLPLLRAHRALRALAPGQRVRIVTTNPQTVAEFQAMARHVPGCELVSQEELGGEFIHLLLRRR